MPFDGAYIKKLKLRLNADQKQAMVDARAAIKARRNHLIEGNAGSGKTTWIQALAVVLREEGVSVALAAPTHQAVKVLAAKFTEAGLSADVMTAHALMGLKPEIKADRMDFKRAKHAQAVTARVVLFDEVSMYGTSLMYWIDRALPNSTVIFVGDDAQLRPVGEKRSSAFDTPSRSRLSIIERQAGDSPILDAADIIRKSQGGPADWSWVKSAHKDGKGVFRPSDPYAWMKRAFLSKEFEDNPMAFRYAAWTNKRVDDVNRTVRLWKYGDHAEKQPFMVEERALVRETLMREADKDTGEGGNDILLNTGEEVTIKSIKQSTKRFMFQAGPDMNAWGVDLPTWAVELVTDTGKAVEAHTARDAQAYTETLERLRSEALVWGRRWGDFHSFKGVLANLRHVPAMTVHSMQGSTVDTVFLDIPDIKRRCKTDLLEAQQLLYVGVTRPRYRLALIDS